MISGNSWALWNLPRCLTQVQVWLKLESICLAYAAGALKKWPQSDLIPRRPAHQPNGNWPNCSRISSILNNFKLINIPKKLIEKVIKWRNIYLNRKTYKIFFRRLSILFNTRTISFCLRQSNAGQWIMIHLLPPHLCELMGVLRKRGPWEYLVQRLQSPDAWSGNH